MKTFKETENIYLVFTGKEADEEIYELTMFGVENENDEDVRLVTDAGGLIVEKEVLDRTEAHYDTGLHLFTDGMTAENWQRNNPAV